MSQKITPFLWFDNNADEAISFYISIFEDSRIVNATRYGDAGPGPKGTIMTAAFELNGQEFMALNGGPQFKFTEAISMVVKCENQDEVDYYWDKLLEGGQPQQCGWLKDKFGLSWQVIPSGLGQLLGDPDPAKARRVLEAMMQMVKIDIAKLKEVHAAT